MLWYFVLWHFRLSKTFGNFPERYEHPQPLLYWTTEHQFTEWEYQKWTLGFSDSVCLCLLEYSYNHYIYSQMDPAHFDRILSSTSNKIKNKYFENYLLETKSTFCSIFGLFLLSFFYPYFHSMIALLYFLIPDFLL